MTNILFWFATYVWILSVLTSFLCFQGIQIKLITPRLCQQISKDAIYYAHVMWSLNSLSKIMFIIVLGTILVSLQNLSTQVLAKRKFRGSSIHGDRDSLANKPPGKLQYMIKCSFRYSISISIVAANLIYTHTDLQITDTGRIINAEVSSDKHPWLVYTMTTFSERTGERTYKEHNIGCPGAIISYSRYIWLI